LSIQYDENTTTYQVSAIFADRLNEDLTNEKDCVSDMSLCARDLLSQIKRGDLFDYFETILPAQAQPFMERFNDNVAGVALDLNIQVFEDINACVQYPTPTPSQTPDQPTPSVTPTSTVTPSVTTTQTNTPSVTPTNTMTPTVTPSSTGLPPSNPQTLGALWWIDFTDSSTLTFGFPSQVYQALDKISNVPFIASPGSGGPTYNSVGYLGVSGTAQTNATQLKNSLGTYTTPFNEYTWFGRVYDDVVSQRGGKIILASNGGSYPLGTTFFRLADFNTNPYPPGPVWEILSRTSAASNFIFTNFTFSAWTNIAIRTYQSGSKVRTEFWENGVEITHTEQTVSLYNTSNVEFNLLFDGGIDFNTEQFFFDKKLTGGEMGQMFTYLNDKY
jgi:hypothetical protein